MNLAIRDLTPDMPSTRMLMERALDPHILVGMPHLGPCGLSETWLMKDLGHRHWLLLARLLGMEDADFRSPDGQEIYASICATSLRKFRLGQTRANDILTIRSALHPLSRTRFASRHVLTVAGFIVGEVELLSVFVARSVDGDNHSLVRVGHRGSSPATAATSNLAQMASQIRRNGSGTYLDIAYGTNEGESTILTPDRFADFNGAGLLYFANFQALFAQACEDLLPGFFHAAERRDIFFFGNARPGESVAISVCRDLPGDHGVSCAMSRSDGKLIARAFIMTSEGNAAR